MHRLDPKLVALKAARDQADTDDQKREIMRDMQQREKDIMPFYQQVALQFADLHDTPGRMLAKKVINDLSLIHISEPTRLLSISYAVFCLKKKKNITQKTKTRYRTS
eukprot:TRINITY_DN5675_c0_g1_i2.p2 TRINITY_DN5675_c0_g1~~TRINITY_DN5675_c0_g1_i2.p2  ORF type:complete len:107 (-),score=31.52 TRINITY_DN5675_c0_g1_i2:19-339(-)